MKILLKLKQYDDGSVSFESKVSPSRFLRIGGDGTVNVQNRAGTQERFFLFEKK